MTTPFAGGWPSVTAGVTASGVEMVTAPETGVSSGVVAGGAVTVATSSTATMSIVAEITVSPPCGSATTATRSPTGPL